MKTPLNDALQLDVGLARIKIVGEVEVRLPLFVLLVHVKIESVEDRRIDLLRARAFPQRERFLDRQRFRV